MAFSVTESALVSIIIESILYGISTFLFGITLWSLTYQRKSKDGAHLMLAVACLLFLLSTVHVVSDCDRVWQGFISSGDPDKFFSDFSKPIDTLKDVILTLETLFGDAILIYRCYIVWRRIQVIIIPIIGWIAVAATGIFSTWVISHSSPVNLNTGPTFLQETSQWLISFYTMTLATNLIATGTLSFKLWLVHRRSSRTRVTRSQVYPIFLIVVECGALYSMALIAMIATHLSKSNSAYIMIDMIGQIIPIAFYLILVRVAILRFNENTGQGLFASTIARTAPSGRLPVVWHTQVHMVCVTVIELDVTKEPGVSSAPVDALEDASHSQVHNRL